MNAIPVHVLTFLAAVALGCGTLSFLTRVLARRMGLPTDRVTVPAVLGVLVGIGLAGGIGQLLYGLLSGALGVPFLLGRLLAWLAVGPLVALLTSLVTPYMPRRRALLVGLLAGLMGWSGFTGMLAFTAEEPLARVAGALLLAATLSLAVLFPLVYQPEEQEEALCACGLPSGSCGEGGGEWGWDPSFSPGMLMPRLPTGGRRTAAGRVAVMGYGALKDPASRPCRPCAKSLPGGVPENDDEYVFELEFRGRDGLDRDDFQVSGPAPGISYEVVSADFRCDPAARVNSGSARIALLFDQSSSILSEDPERERLRAGEQFVDLLPSTVEVGVFAFGQPGELRPGSELSGFTSEAAQTKTAIQGLAGHEGGGTPTYSALRSVVASFPVGGKKGQRAILCFTDGVPAPKEARQLPLLHLLARAKGIAIWFVALGSASADWSASENLARATGGKLVRVEEAHRLAEAFSDLAGQVVQMDEGTYHLVVRATRSGGPFLGGERLTPQVTTRGGQLPRFTKTIVVPARPAASRSAAVGGY